MKKLLGHATLTSRLKILVERLATGHQIRIFKWIAVVLAMAIHFSTPVLAKSTAKIRKNKKFIISETLAPADNQLETYINKYAEFKKPRCFAVTGSEGSNPKTSNDLEIRPGPRCKSKGIQWMLVEIQTALGVEPNDSKILSKLYISKSNELGSNYLVKKIELDRTEAVLVVSRYQIDPGNQQTTAVNDGVMWKIYTNCNSTPVYISALQGLDATGLEAVKNGRKDLTPVLKKIMMSYHCRKWKKTLKGHLSDGKQKKMVQRPKKLLADELAQSLVIVRSSDNVDFVVTDPRGRKSGVNPLSHDTYSDLPSSLYETESIGSDDPDAPNASTPAERSFTDSLALTGPYTLDAYSKKGGSFYVIVRSQNELGSANGWQEFKGVMKPNGRKRFKFEHRSLFIPYLNATLALTSVEFSYSQSSKIYRLKAKGMLKPTVSTKPYVPFKSKLKVIIGGVKGFFRTISKDDFKTNKDSHNPSVNYQSPYDDLFITLYASGRFEILAKNLDLSRSPKELKNTLVLSIDDLAGATRIALGPRR